MAFHRIFPFCGNLHIPKHWELHGFSSTLNLRGSEEYGKSLCFPILFPYHVNSLFPYFGDCMDFYFTQNIYEAHKFETFAFSHTFPVLWKSTFSMFRELDGFLLHTKNLRNPMGVLFSHILGIVWINASHELCKRPIALKCLYFPISFPYYDNSVFPCFWNCMGFYYTRNRGVWNM